MDLINVIESLMEIHNVFHKFDINYKVFISLVQKSIINFSKIINVEIENKSSILFKQTGFKSVDEVKKFFDTSLCLLSLTGVYSEQFWQNITLRFKNKIEKNTQEDLISSMQFLFDKFDEQKDLFFSYKEKSIIFYNDILSCFIYVSLMRCTKMYIFIW